VVMSVVVVTMGLVYPPVHSLYARTNASSARDVVQSYLSTARAVAVQRGATSVFHSVNQRVWITVDSAGTQVPFRIPIRLDSSYKSTISATSDSIVFNGRGVAVGLSTVQYLTIAHGGELRTVCASQLGSVLKGGCP